MLPGSLRAEPKMATPFTVESVSKPSTNSPMMRKIRQVSLTAKSSMGSRRGGSKLRSFSEFRPVIIGSGPRDGKRLSALVRVPAESMLAQVISEVPGVDAEQPGRLLAHAARAPLRLQQQ